MSVTLDYDTVYSAIENPLVPGYRPRNSGFYELQYEDAAIRTPTESGYVFSRPRFRRTKARRTFKFGYKDLTRAQKNIIEDFWNSTQGGSFPFYWRNWDEMRSAMAENGVTSPTVQMLADHLAIVRFTAPPDIKMKAVGLQTHFDITMTVQEA